MQSILSLLVSHYFLIIYRGPVLPLHRFCFNRKVSNTVKQLKKVQYVRWGEMFKFIHRVAQDFFIFFKTLYVKKLTYSLFLISARHVKASHFFSILAISFLLLHILLKQKQGLYDQAIYLDVKSKTIQNKPRAYNIRCFLAITRHK